MKPAVWPILAAAVLPIRLQAQPPAPTLVPTRDVDVLYRMAEGRTERMRWQISARKLRIDITAPNDPAADGFVIIDIATRHVAFVRPAAHTVMDTTADGLPVPAPGPGGFSRLGIDAVAGLACTVWATRGLGDTQAQSCLTDDGVLLRTRALIPGKADVPAHTGTLLEAATVKYGPNDPGAFLVPPGFAHIQDPTTP